MRGVKGLHPANLSLYQNTIFREILYRKSAVDFEDLPH